MSTFLHLNPNGRRIFQEFYTQGSFAADGAAFLSRTGTTANSYETGELYGLLSTANAAGNSAGSHASNFNIFRAEANPLMNVFMKTTAGITNQRLWIGITSAPNTNSDTAAGNFAGFLYSTTIGGEPTWKYITRDGTTQFVIDSGIPYLPDTAYRLSIWLVGDTAFFQIDNNSIVSSNRNTPLLTTNLGFQYQLFNTITGSRSWKFKIAILEYN